MAHILLMFSLRLLYLNVMKLFWFFCVDISAGHDNKNVNFQYCD